MEEIVIVHWPGKDTPACPRHLEQLVGLGAVLGVKVSWSIPLLGQSGIECKNCTREKEKAARQ